jgi:nicotinamide riboside kinase
MFKIGLISTHATGKTTLAHLLAGEFKKRGFKTRVIDEVAAEASESGIPINQQTTLAAQAWILHKQVLYELQADIRGYQVVVCDRTVLDNYIYLERAVGRDNEYLDIALSHVKKFPYNILFRLPLIGDANPDGIRATESDFRMAIDKKLTALLDEFDINYITLPMPAKMWREDWVEFILNTVLPKLGSLKDFSKHSK